MFLYYTCITVFYVYNVIYSGHLYAHQRLPRNSLPSASHVTNSSQNYARPEFKRSHSEWHRSAAAYENRGLTTAIESRSRENLTNAFNFHMSLTALATPTGILLTQNL